MAAGLQIIGTGAALPSRKMTAAACDAANTFPMGKVLTETGVAIRYYCGAQDSQISMGVAAAQAALANAELNVQDIDLVICASAVPYQPIPATAPALQAALGIADGSAFAFDINSTCLSFVTALETCDALLAAGRYKRALIVSSEVASRALPWPDRPDIAGLFGDGAAAMVVTIGDGRSGLIATAFETHPTAYDICGIGAGGTRFDFHADSTAFAAHSLFAMDGHALFRLSHKHFMRFVGGLLDKAGWTAKEVDCVVPHQASPMALAHMVRNCGFNARQVVNICESHGNQIAASIPTAFAHAQSAGRIVAGAKVLMLGTSAGVSFGGAALIV